MWKRCWQERGLDQQICSKDSISGKNGLVKQDSKKKRSTYGGMCQ